jgi:ankyrin repeat protein
MSTLHKELAANLIALERLNGLIESLRLKYDEASEWRPKIDKWFPQTISEIESDNVEIERIIDDPGSDRSRQKPPFKEGLLLYYLDRKEVNQMLQTSELSNAFLECLTTKGKGLYTRLLLQSERIDPTILIGDPVSKCDAITIALRAGNTQAVKALVDDGRIKPTEANMNYAAKKGFVNCMTIFLRQLGPTNEILSTAIEFGRHKVVNLLLADGRIAPTNDNLQRAIKIATDSVGDTEDTIHGISSGPIDIIKMLLADGRVNPSIGLEPAIESEDIAITKMLLDDPRTDPSFNDNQPLIAAIGAINYEIVELLIKDPRVKPTLYVLITEMIENGYDRDSELEINKGHSYLSVDDELEIKWHSDLRVVDEIDDDESERSYEPELTFDEAAKFRRIISLFIRVAPVSKESFQIAVQNGWVEVIKIFLADAKYDPNDVLREVINLNWTDSMEVITLFLKDPRTNLTQARKLVGTRKSIGAQKHGPCLSSQIISLIDAIESSV